MKRVSKSTFKSRALQYFREIESTAKPLVITDRGKPVLKIAPFTGDPDQALKELRHSVLKYDDPTDPVGLEDREKSGDASRYPRLDALPKTHKRVPRQRDPL